MIGMIPREWHSPTPNLLPATSFVFYVSVRAKIRDEVDGYSTSMNYWLRCLYKGETGNPEDVENGFLKGKLLVWVCIFAATVVPSA